MAGRNNMSVKQIIENGNKSHLTKAEIERRQENEKQLEKLDSSKIRPPKWLGKDAKKVFKDIVKEMRVLDILVNVDVYGLAIIADAMEKYIMCTVTLHSEELKIITVTKFGEKLVENPTIGTQRKYAEIFNKYAANFGLSPASRLKIINQNMPELDNDEEEFEREFG